MSEVIALLARVHAAKCERQKANASIQKNFAPNFNPVALLAPSETRLSEVLRWLLDEHETHGQGAHFRDSFVTDLVGGTSSDWVNATVACEVVTADSQGRIDVLIKSADGRRRIAIENKPWACWQDAQLLRYLQDQAQSASDVRVLALIGAADANAELQNHWSEYSEHDCPANVTAHNFDTLATWLEDCAASVRPHHVRDFLINAADYCRSYVMNEPDLSEGSETADLLVGAGPDLLKAAIDVAEALPRALTQQVANLVGGLYHRIGVWHAVQIHQEGVPLSFVLFGTTAAWAGVTDSKFVGLLSSQVAWATPEKNWPGWAWVKNLNDEGQILAKAAAKNDFERAAELLPAVAQVLLRVQTGS